ncbi:uncharacterized protein LOC135502388 isoform X2 [Lineus longissimus]|uniref:uncharacterized protein LOC135502388 isoform X2 n=1 Tax=Lineus longissimus TaxID=88925 RepID=UPI00315C4CDC
MRQGNGGSARCYATAPPTFADKIHMLLRRQGEEVQLELLFTVLSKTESALKNIKHCYKKTFLNDLVWDAMSDVRNHTVKAILVKVLGRS